MGIRAEALKRSGYLCVRCTEEARLALATQVDHRLPLDDGGTDEQSNLDGLCKRHHDAKTADEAARRARR